MMERKFAKFFHRLVQELIPDNGHREHMFDALRRYQSSQKLHQLLGDLRQVLDEPDKLELYEFIRPLILLRHQMEYSYLTPPAPGVRLRTIRLHRASNQSLGFAVRGGYEFNVGVFVSKVEPGSQADKQGLKVGDEIVRVNGFTIAEAIHDDVLNLIKSRDEIVLKVTHIGMLPVKEHATDTVTWQYVEDMDSKRALDEVLSEKQVNGGKGVELKIFIDCTGYESIGCGILSGPSYYPGIFVEKVRPGSLAQEVGLEVGDQIVEVNDSSFQNIGHKEAVVVLKGSKQLNVIIRKHAGLPLFDHRQATSRGSSMEGASLSSSTTHNRSPPVSQRSVQPSRSPADSVRLDEDQLIAEQLSRAALLKKTTTTTTNATPSPDYPSHQSSTDSHVISTQAEVHSDSDSYHGSGVDVPPLHAEEPPSADFPPTLTPSSSRPHFYPTHTHTHPIPSPSPTRHTPSPTAPALPLLHPLPDNLDTPVRGQTVTSLTFHTAPTSTPEHLTHHTAPTNTATETDESPSAPSPTDTPTPTPLSLPEDLGDPVLRALRRPVYPRDCPSWVVPRMHFDPPEDDLSESHQHAEYAEHVHSGEERGEVGGGTGDLQAGALVHNVGHVTDRFQGGDSGGRPHPPVFIPPPPPPSSPPPPTVSASLFISRDLVPDSLKMSPAVSRTSSTSAQAPDDALEAVLEFGSESEESTHGGGTEVEEFKAEVNDVRQGNGDIADSPKVTGFSEQWGQEAPVVAVAYGVGKEMSAQIHTAGTEVTMDHDLPLPPPPPTFFYDDDDEEDRGDKEVASFLTPHTRADCDVTDQMTNVPPLPSVHPPPPPTQTGTYSPLPPPPPPPPQPVGSLPVPRPPSPTPSLVLSGAAAVLAARREVEEEEERSPRLLGPAEPGLSVGAVGGVHQRLAAWFNPFELDGRELRSFSFPKDQSLGVAMEGGTGTPLAGRIVVAAVFGSGAAVEHGLQTGDQLMMINSNKLTNVSVTEAEQILEDAYGGTQDMIEVVYAQSNFLNDEECVTYF
ncbi:uncharacterized protein LOC143301586 isoform X2 [Babylonia areolata]|uniref:uncharacterized protein LOC143301586 isoform X2 n=1 Tax=Babylonia areolata TaxID=304850 RepID=UPI003FD03C32